MPKRHKHTIGLIGAGKVGIVLTTALLRAGHTVQAVWDPSDRALVGARETLGPCTTPAHPWEVRPGSDLVLVAVPDDALPGLVETLAANGDDSWAGTTVVHVSGRYGTAVLAPIVARGAVSVALHPAMAFNGDRDLELQRIVGARFAVTAEGSARHLAKSLVSDMGGIPFEVAENDRMLYHAAMAHASNHLVTLIVQSMSMLDEVGVNDPSTVLRPAVVAALENVLQLGFDGATGPVVRGDAGTVEGHLGAIDRRTPQFLKSYKVLSQSTADQALKENRLSSGTHTKLLAEIRRIKPNEQP